jgi:hypothetical protein
MPGEVIDRVHALAAQNPAGSELLFGWRNGTEIPGTPTDEDDLHNEDYDPADDDSDDDSSQAPGPPPVADEAASQQLHDRKTIKPRASEDMTRKEKRNALACLMFIKEKRSGTTKARGCADGRKQRLCKTKQETSSPTARTESLLLSCVIDAKEGWQVMTCDIPGAFMQVNVDEVVHVRLSGALATLLENVEVATVEFIRGHEMIDRSKKCMEKR